MPALGTATALQPCQLLHRQNVPVPMATEKYHLCENVRLWECFIIFADHQQATELSFMILPWPASNQVKNSNVPGQMDILLVFAFVA